MAVIHSERDHTIIELENDDDGWAAIHFTTKRGPRCLVMNPDYGFIRLFTLDEDGEPSVLIKELNIEHLENPSLENDE